MNTKLTLITAFLLGTFAIASAQPKEIKDGMKAAYDKLAQAYNKRDIDAVMNMTSGDFEWKMLDGTVVKRDKAKDSLKELFTKIDTGKWTVKLTNTLGAGSLAETTAEFTFDGTLLDASKKPYKAAIISVERQTWHQDKSGWHQTKSEIISQKTVTGGLKAIPNVDSGGTGSSGGGYRKIIAF